MASKLASQPAPSALLAVVLPAIVLGIAVNLIAFRGPYAYVQHLFYDISPFKLRQQALGKAWGATATTFSAKSFGFDPATFAGAAVEYSTQYLLAIVAFFQNFLGTWFGKALLIGITGHAVPLASFMVLESLKSPRNAVTGILYAVFVQSIGQFICIGAAMPIFWIPYYAYNRIAEARANASTVFPLASPPVSSIALATVCNTLVLSSVLACSFVPNESDIFIWANLYFQFFPFLFLPLVFVSTAPVGGKSKTNHLADSYALLALVALLMQAGATYISWPVIPKLLHALLDFGKRLTDAKTLASFAHPLGLRRLLAVAHESVKPVLENDGEWLLLLDDFGVCAAGLALVLVDAVVDEWIVTGTSGKKGSAKRVHAKWSIANILFVTAPATLVLGPGVTLSLYLRNRELNADKAREEQTSKSK